MRDSSRGLGPLFRPRAVAVIGASGSPGKWGFGIFHRLIRSTGDFKVFPVNPNAREVLGVPAHGRITDLKEDVDLAVIVVPPESVPPAMEDCVKKGVRAAVVITAGFKETGQEGAALETELVRIARRGGMRFVGPNCNGHFDAEWGLFTTGGFRIRPGPIGLISQSGNFGGYIVARGSERGIGFSKYVSSGNEADLHVEDYLEYLGQDDSTRIICAYVEGLKEGRRFLSLAAAIARKKPVIVMKVGRTAEGARAAMSHTGSLAGTDPVHDAAFKQSGVIRVDEVDELLDVASALIRQPLPRGARVGIVTGGGGFGVVATDACRRLGLEIPSLAPDTIGRIDRFLPPRWSHANPVDMAGDSMGSYGCLGSLLKAEEIDSVLAVSCIGFSPQPTDSFPAGIREEIERYQKMMEDGEEALVDGLVERIDRYEKPLILAAVGDGNRSKALAKLQRHGIFAYPTPEAGAKVIAYLTGYARYLRGVAPLAET